jgi:uncharacterized pyridoxal phosphate-dependent enzyme
VLSPRATAAPEAAAPAQIQTAGTSIYSTVGVRPLVNARGTVTIIGATRTLPEVKQAMEAAARDYVQLDELMDGVGRRLAELTGAEWGIVTSGASAALTVATAGCLTGGDPDRMAQLPDLAGLPDEVVTPRYSRTAYDHAIKAVGATVVEVATYDELVAALGPRTAMVMVLAGRGSEEGPLSLRRIAEVARPLGIPILVDAAAETLDVPNPHLAQGADLVAYSGGKCLRGPQCAGLLLGRKPLVQAAWINSAPHHGLGRGLKVGREEIMGMLAAVEMWMRRDHEAEARMWTGWLEHIAARVGRIPGVTTEIRQPRGRSNRTPSLGIGWDPARIPLTGHDVEMLLYEGEPRIAVSGAGSFLPFPPNLQPNIRISPYQLEAGEERIIAERVYQVLSSPPPAKPAPPAPAFDLAGRWEVDVEFAARRSRQVFVLAQDGAALSGTHHASFAPRAIAGALHGRDVVLRSSYTENGVRLNFTFTGTAADAASMAGDLHLGEYGAARWSARRVEG